MKFLDFLKRHLACKSLDSREVKKQFGNGIKRADFVLFGGTVVCEYKEILTMNVKGKVEKLYQKGALPQEVFMREMHSTILTNLSEADVQIADTKRVLSFPGALGLVVLENKIPNSMSVAVLMQAANSQLQAGMPNVDAVFCIDLVNFFTNPEGKRVMPIQLVCRPGARSERLNALWEPLVQEFCRVGSRPFIGNSAMGEIHVRWNTRNGEFSGLSARLVRKGKPTA